MPEKVAAIFGGAAVMPERHEGCIEEARKLLEAAEAGEVVGFAVIRIHGDKTCSYSISGMAGGFAMLGGAEMVKAELTNMNFGFDE